jgi:hypothetical protein
VMKDSARYAKLVEWSEEDNCYIGTAPGLMEALFQFDVGVYPIAQAR